MKKIDSIDDPPTAVRLPARCAMGLLFFSTDNHGLLKFPAVLTAGSLEGARRCNAAVVAAVGIVPGRGLA